MVSKVQSSRKKRYWSKIGCLARKLDGNEPFCDRSVPFDWSLPRLSELDGNGGSGGGGDSGKDGDEGVAFSMRAHVK